MKRAWIVILLLLAAIGAVTGFYVVRASDRRPVSLNALIVHAERRTVPMVLGKTSHRRLFIVIGIACRT